LNFSTIGRMLDRLSICCSMAASRLLISSVTHLFDQIVGDLLLADLIRGLRDVLRRDVDGGDDGEDRQNDRGDADDPPAALEDGDVIFCVQWSMAKHSMLLTSAQDGRRWASR
jgi:hypothetical protein